MSNGKSDGTAQRVSLGRAKVPVQFGEQVIVSILYNHDANPVHHKPDHAIQWMLGLLAAQGVGGSEGGLEQAGPEERTYTLGTKLLERQDVVVMPGIVLAAIAHERFVQPSELTVSMTTTFTYPLLVPTKGGVEVAIEASEAPPGSVRRLPEGCREIQIEAYGPGLSDTPVRLLKLEALVMRPGASPARVYEQFVAPQFAELAQSVGKLPGSPALTHPSAISQEDRRRYSRIVDPAGIAGPPNHGENGKVRPITESAWQCKIPRVLTEVIDHLRNNDAYQNEVRAYYAGRPEEAERREAIKRYVAKERKYGWLKEEHAAARVEELAQLRQHLYARQHTVFDPRCFCENGPAKVTGAQMFLDLQLVDMRLRRAVHRFCTRARLQDEPVFMGEATIMAQPLVTRELANFLCETNHSFNTLRLFTYNRA
ncbi:MAG: hypothetical protein NTW87_03405 [Planctomycetota bacterium]|nr:hypothetical protein [Planctomycetota bacterium]